MPLETSIEQSNVPFSVTQLTTSSQLLDPPLFLHPGLLNPLARQYNSFRIRSTDSFLVSHRDYWGI
jgi:hypothetical protein